MRTEEDVSEFTKDILPRYTSSCKECSGTDQRCACWRRAWRAVSSYEACIPQDFWDVKAEDVVHNVEVFNSMVVPYAEKLSKALRGGYGLVLIGDNGVGKTMLLSYVLVEAIKAARTAYYTTMPQLDWNIKEGFNNPASSERLKWMLTSDFLAIDELGKERKKRDSQFSDQQIERILKQRFDDSMPVLIGSNMDVEQLSEAYGSTIGSILRGKYQVVQMEPGDFRDSLHERMKADMG